MIRRVFIFGCRRSPFVTPGRDGFWLLDLMAKNARGRFVSVSGLENPTVRCGLSVLVPGQRVGVVAGCPRRVRRLS